MVSRNSATCARAVSSSPATISARRSEAPAGRAVLRISAAGMWLNALDHPEHPPAGAAPVRWWSSTRRPVRRSARRVAGSSCWRPPRPCPRTAPDGDRRRSSTEQRRQPGRPGSRPLRPCQPCPRAEFRDQSGQRLGSAGVGDHHVVPVTEGGLATAVPMFPAPTMPTVLIGNPNAGRGHLIPDALPGDRDERHPHRQLLPRADGVTVSGTGRFDGTSAPDASLAPGCDNTMTDLDSPPFDHAVRGRFNAWFFARWTATSTVSPRPLKRIAFDGLDAARVVEIGPGRRQPALPAGGCGVDRHRAQPGHARSTPTAMRRRRHRPDPVPLRRPAAAT